MSVRTVTVPAARIERWIDGFAQRHGGSTQQIAAGTLRLVGQDGATAAITPPFPVEATDAEAFIAGVQCIPRTGVFLVRRGGFAAALVEGDSVIASDVGKRHVQGRTAAGGWSQQRFARRRQKQSNELVDAAVDYAARVIVPALPIDYLVTGGDRPLIDQALADPRIRALAALPRGPHVEIQDPTRAVVATLPERLTTVRIDLIDP